MIEVQHLAAEITADAEGQVAEMLHTCQERGQKLHHAGRYEFYEWNAPYMAEPAALDRPPRPIPPVGTEPTTRSALAAMQKYNKGFFRATPKSKRDDGKWYTALATSGLILLAVVHSRASHARAWGRRRYQPVERPPPKTDARGRWVARGPLLVPVIDCGDDMSKLSSFFFSSRYSS